MKWHRPAATNTKLITVLVLAVLAAGIYWVVKMSTGGDEVVVKTVENYELWCTACREKTLIPAGEAKMRPRQGGRLQCPKCQAWAGSWGPPDSDGGLVAP